MRKTVVIVSRSAQWWIDDLPPPLLFSTPLDNGLVTRKTGCPLSASVIIICPAILSHSPLWTICTDRVPLVYLIQVRRMTIVVLRILFKKEKSVEHLIRTFLLSFDLHDMSLNIDMKIIRPEKNLWCFTQSQH